MTNEQGGLAITPRIVVGLLIVGFGAALTLDNLDIIESGDLIRYWPFGVIAIGVAKLLQDRARSSRITGALFVLIGSVIAAEEFLHLEIDIWRWWPLVIVAFGLLIISKAFRPASPPDRQEAGIGMPDAGVQFGSMAKTPPRPGTLSQSLSEFAIWSGIQRRVSSPAFRRADLTAIMGGIELDLRQAGTEAGEAVVDVFVLWGGIEIVVPPDWAVANEVTPILGGAEDQSTGTQQARHRLVVKGVVIMGGVDIKT